MTQRIFGYYSSEKKAIKIVNSLALKGYKAKNITIFTNYSSVQSLQKYTDVNIQSSVQELEEKDSFLDQLRKVFLKRPEQYVNFYNQLISFGMSEELAEGCLAKINSGKILVIVDDDIMKLGHAPLNEVFRLKLKE